MAFNRISKKLAGLIRNRSHPFDSCPESISPLLPNEKSAVAHKRRRNEHQIALEKSIYRFVDTLVDQWPTEEIYDPTDPSLHTYIAVTKATNDAQSWFQIWHHNAIFKETISQVQLIPDGLDTKDQKLLTYSFSQPCYHHQPKRFHVGFNDIMKRSPPNLPAVPIDSFDNWYVQQDGKANYDELRSILIRLSRLPGQFEHQYAVDLQKSFESLEGSADVNDQRKGVSAALMPQVENLALLCKSHVDGIYQAICRCLREEISIAHQLACRANTWPRLSTISLLRQLATGIRSTLRDDWKGC